MAPQSPDLNPIEQLWDVVEEELCALDVHPTNLHQLQDAILSIWAKISRECFQHLVESMTELRQFWRKGVKHSIMVFLIILYVWTGRFISEEKLQNFT